MKFNNFEGDCALQKVNIAFIIKPISKIDITYFYFISNKKVEIQV